MSGFLVALLVMLCACPRACYSQVGGDGATGAAAADADPSMDPEEARAVFDVLQAINYEIDWRALFPGDNPCTGGPHGVNCDLDNNLLHVVELNLGWVSDFVNNPPCSSNASIHPSILKFRHLKKLFFYQCFFGQPMAIPDEVWQLGPSLLHLTFQDNTALVGSIPPGLSNLTSLERLVLTENRLEGSIPGELGRMRNLKQLVLSHNLINGTIPDSLGDLDNLLILDLSGNMLTGGIAERLGALARLEKMDLSMNHLQGKLPIGLGNAANRMRFLDLSYNNLSGGVPESFSALAGLQNLFLRGNPLLGGELPRFLGNLSSLEMVALSCSGFVGSIPDSIGGLLKLNSLALDGNMLSGVIPPSMGRLERLYHLNLSSNELSGPLPFPQEFMSRLGRNLVVRNNTGLCYSMDLKGSLGDVSSFGISYCDRSSSLAFGGTSQHVASLVSGGESGRTSARTLQLIGFVALCCCCCLCFL